MPQHLFEAWDKVAPELREQYVALFLDYDGTLTPIAEQPHLAKLDPDIKNVLRELSRHDGIKIGIISGRSLFDLEKRVRIPGLIYAGNHGFEIHSPKMRHVHPSAEEFKKLLRKIAGRLQKTYASLPGIIVENKMFTLSIHYRQLASEKVDYAKLLLYREVGPHLGRPSVVLTEGKKVWEVRPAIQWDKGKTVLWLFGRVLFSAGSRVLPVYIGDDPTDESAFAALKRRGVSIKVTENPGEATEAGFYLESPEEVFEFLKRLKQIKILKKYGVTKKAAANV